MHKLDVQLATWITHKARQDIGVLASIEGSFVGRIVRNVILVEIDRRRHEIETYRPKARHK